MDLKRFKTDEHKETQGAWVRIDDHTRLLVARHGNRRYRQALKRLQKPYAAAIRSDALDETVQERILIEALAEGVLLDWDGMSEHGAEVPYSKAKAMEVLAAYPDFRDLVTSLALDAQHFRDEELQEAEKN